jgi:hypothetical protein
VSQSSTPEASVRRVHITCERCGRGHSLERLLTQPETVYIVCHDCEASLRAHHPGASSPERSRPPGRDGETAR